MFTNDENPNDLRKIQLVDLAKETDLPPESIHRVLKKLEDQGYIQINRPKSDELKEQSLIKSVDKGDTTSTLSQEELWMLFKSRVVNDYDMADDQHKMMIVEDNDIDKTIECLNRRLQIAQWLDLKSRIVRTYKMAEGKHSMIILKK
ncbi:MULTISPECIES: MarR family transcriptional regulator [Bacillales]|uniref:Winged helix DNA-binding domain protein n=1 Tax=Anoxybacteroides amylolyticum TaxID=294699 RepID=A0A161HTJ7_9BACL|nr:MULTISPECIES: helix-turn-helix domain-containing protein [Bacillaceae]ANB59201.1 winged helix DNA-binding domain protein [Anoxybacillus amylolyticus]